MNNRFVDGGWRYGIGVVVAIAMLSGVAGHASPHGSDEAAHGTSKSGTEVTRLVTGDPAQINSIVAGSPPSAILEIVPVPAKVGTQAYTINGSSISAANGGFRAWFEVKISNWDPNADGSPGLKAGQVRVDAAGYTSGKGDPLGRAVVACANPGARATCAAAFGELFTECDLTPGSPTFQTCKAGYNKSDNRSDSICAGSGGGCDVEDTSTANVNYLWFWVNASNTGRAEDQGPGFKYYAGTLVLDVPPGAMGTYCVPLITDQTFIFDTSFPPVKIPTAQENGFCVVIATGSCCYDLGNPPGACIESLTLAECGDDEPGPFIFTPDGHCPPQGPDCSSFLGACCETISGECLDEVLEADCQGQHLVWTSGTSCDEAACIAETGACCDHDPFGPCADDTVLSDCQCATCTWHKLQPCAEIECAPTPIPTISEWGLAILTLLLLTGAKILFARTHVGQEAA